MKQLGKFQPKESVCQNFVNEKFGRLRILKQVGVIKYKTCTVIVVECKCDCGNTSIVRKPKLINGHTQSCGCLQKETIRDLSKTHGLSKSSTYSSWASMINRCTNKNIEQFQNYGGKGVSVCKEWLNFENFLSDMGVKPSKDHQIDRIDNNGNYEPSNCKWSTRIENCNNKSNNVKYNYKGEILSVTEISRRSGIVRSRISNWKNRSNYSQDKIELLIDKYSM